jgi:DNA polymerase (family 10)
MTNDEISDILNLTAKLYDIHGENPFKSKGYSIAAFQIDKLEKSIMDIPRAEWSQIKGIGDSASRAIAEIIDTGRNKSLETLLIKTPEGILELMKIKGLGPKKISTIWKELEIESPGELWYACMENRLLAYKGFGEKTQKSILESLDFYFANQKKYLYAQVEPFVQEITLLFNEKFDVPFQVCGTFAMQEDVIEHLSFLVASTQTQILETLKSGNFRLIESKEDYLMYSYLDHIEVRIYPCRSTEFVQEAIRLSSTESYWSQMANRGIEEKTFANESDFFTQNGIPYLPACLRREVELPAYVQPSHLIQPNDVRGVIHSHSRWSDGSNSIEEMARACIARGYEYLVMSDHSVSSFYANGLSVERIQQQQEEIDRLNTLLAPFHIFKSIECDILNDGRLDYSNEVLATFDLVIASVHQNLNMTEEKAMERILNAVQNPHTTILGHPSGRLLLSRKAYPLNYPRLIEACKAHQVVMEINAHPRRLDLDWNWVGSAISAGVMLSINPDAHSLQGIEDIRFGVLSAQKAGLQAEHNLSSMNLGDFRTFLAERKANRA